MSDDDVSDGSNDGTISEESTEEEEDESLPPSPVPGEKKKIKARVKKPRVPKPYVRPLSTYTDAIRPEVRASKFAVALSVAHNKNPYGRPKKSDRLGDSPIEPVDEVTNLASLATDIHDNARFDLYESLSNHVFAPSTWIGSKISKAEKRRIAIGLTLSMDASRYAAMENLLKEWTKSQTDNAEEVLKQAIKLPQILLLLSKRAGEFRSVVNGVVGKMNRLPFSTGSDHESAQKKARENIEERSRKFFETVRNAYAWVFDSVNRIDRLFPAEDLTAETLRHLKNQARKKAKSEADPAGEFHYVEPNDTLVSRDFRIHIVKEMMHRASGLTDTDVCSILESDKTSSDLSDPAPSADTGSYTTRMIALSDQYLAKTAISDYAQPALKKMRTLYLRYGMAVSEHLWSILFDSLTPTGPQKTVPMIETIHRCNHIFIEMYVRKGMPTAIGELCMAGIVPHPVMQSTYMVTTQSGRDSSNANLLMWPDRVLASVDLTSCVQSIGASKDEKCDPNTFTDKISPAKMCVISDYCDPSITYLTRRGFYNPLKKTSSPPYRSRSLCMLAAENAIKHILNATEDHDLVTREPVISSEKGGGLNGENREMLIGSGRTRNPRFRAPINTPSGTPPFQDPSFEGDGIKSLRFRDWVTYHRIREEGEIDLNVNEALGNFKGLNDYISNAEDTDRYVSGWKIDNQCRDRRTYSYRTCVGGVINKIENRKTSLSGEYVTATFKISADKSVKDTGGERVSAANDRLFSNDDDRASLENMRDNVVRSFVTCRVSSFPLSPLEIAALRAKGEKASAIAQRNFYGAQLATGAKGVFDGMAVHIKFTERPLRKRPSFWFKDRTKMRKKKSSEKEEKTLKGSAWKGTFGQIVELDALCEFTEGTPAEQVWNRPEWMLLLFKSLAAIIHRLSDEEASRYLLLVRLDNLKHLGARENQIVYLLRKYLDFGLLIDKDALGDPETPDAEPLYRNATGDGAYDYDFLASSRKIVHRTVVMGVHPEDTIESKYERVSYAEPWLIRPMPTGEELWKLFQYHMRRFFSISLGCAYTRGLYQMLYADVELNSANIKRCSEWIQPTQSTALFKDWKESEKYHRSRRQAVPMKHETEPDVIVVIEEPSLKPRNAEQTRPDLDIDVYIGNANVPQSKTPTPMYDITECNIVVLAFNTTESEDHGVFVRQVDQKYADPIDVVGGQVADPSDNNQKQVKHFERYMCSNFVPEEVSVGEIMESLVHAPTTVTFPITGPDSLLRRPFSDAPGMTPETLFADSPPPSSPETPLKHKKPSNTNSTTPSTPGFSFEFEKPVPSPKKTAAQPNPLPTRNSVDTIPKLIDANLALLRTFVDTNKTTKPMFDYLFPVFVRHTMPVEALPYIPRSVLEVLAAIESLLRRLITYRIEYGKKSHSSVVEMLRAAYESHVYIVSSVQSYIEGLVLAPDGRRSALKDVLESNKEKYNAETKATSVVPNDHGAFDTFKKRVDPSVWINLCADLDIDPALLKEPTPNTLTIETSQSVFKMVGLLNDDEAKKLLDPPAINEVKGVAELLKSIDEGWTFLSVKANEIGMFHKVDTTVRELVNRILSGKEGQFGFDVSEDTIDFLPE